MAKQERILVADDESVIRELMVDVLGDEGADEPGHQHAAEQERDDRLGKAPRLVHPRDEFLAVEPPPHHGQDRQEKRAGKVPAMMKHPGDPFVARWRVVALRGDVVDVEHELGALLEVAEGLLELHP